MGLFSNDKKCCPICGEPTPRLFPTKVDLPNGALDNMSLGDFEHYIAFYDGN